MRVVLTHFNFASYNQIKLGLISVSVSFKWIQKIDVMSIMNVSFCKVQCTSPHEALQIKGLGSLEP